jgi:hypothetical protein
MNLLKRAVAISLKALPPYSFFWGGAGFGWRILFMKKIEEVINEIL